MSRFTKFAWFNVGYMVLVILMGASVRITGSGAGCGRHWPRCNGEVLPSVESMHTVIEFSHRITSMLAGFVVIGLLVWSFRGQFGTNTRLVRLGAIMSFIFILIEGGLGAMLVQLRLVEDNASALRAVVIALHLVNTYVLLLWSVLAAWASQAEPVTMRMSRWAWGLVAGVVGMALLSAAGAVTALGDTLLLSGALERQFGPEGAMEHFLIQLRVIHPMMAIVVSAYLLILGVVMRGLARFQPMRPYIYAVMGVVVANVLVGLFTIALQAPIPMQLTHLALANALWISLLLLTFSTMARVRNEAPQAARQLAG